jgi:broad specificity phosphatase PhoE
MSVEIYLLRHGETEWNLEGRLQGHLDSPLTERGRLQAKQLGETVAERLRGRDGVTLQTSPLLRARETAAILSAVAGFAEPALEARLREITMGSWDGLTPDEIAATWPGAFDGASRDDRYFHSPDGERLEAAAARAATWVREQSGCVVAVSHGIIGKLIRGAYLGLSPVPALGLRAPHGVVWRLARGESEAIACPF